jgi:vanillate O-demethylase ferredoxin subunit
MSEVPDTLRLRVARIEYAAEGIHLVDLRHPRGEGLPGYEPGAHVDLHLPGGLIRPYSLVDPPGADAVYRVAIKRDALSRGGSAYVHERLRVGDMLLVGQPRNLFALDESAPHAVFVAGGIGVTPVACMVQRLRALGRPCTVHYSVRRRAEAALMDRLAGVDVRLHVDEEAAGRLLDVAQVVADAPEAAVLYGCGPASMLQAFEEAAGLRPGLKWRVERFAPAAPAAQAGGFSVRLAASGRTVAVPAGQTILEALRNAGMTVRASCRQGICGTCETSVLEGTPDHRDALLSADERRSNKVMMICCSGSLTPELVLDL